MKANTSLRVVTALFGISMLAGYVVYSQLHHTKRAASSSKYEAPPNFSAVSGGGQAQVTTNTRDVIASSSKSVAPLLPGPNLRGASTRIEPAQVPHRVIAAPQHQLASQGTNTARPLKP